MQLLFFLEGKLFQPLGTMVISRRWRCSLPLLALVSGYSQAFSPTTVSVSSFTSSRSKNARFVAELQVINTPQRSISFTCNKFATSRYVQNFSSSLKSSSSVGIHIDIDTDNEITEKDEYYMNLALAAAETGFGQTYPNPAVGCVLVHKQLNQEDVVIGTGFHPKAGMPHAEVFALFEAAGLVEDGVEAAKSVMPQTTLNPEKHSDEQQALAQRVQDLLDQYCSEEGASILFKDCCKIKSESKIKTDDEVSEYEYDDMEEEDSVLSGTTAYVTLEPCCHTGKTPPCAVSFVHAGVSRVVVGFRDPNPRVDGGGVKLLRDNGVRVDYFTKSKKTLGNSKKCAKIVDCFVKRITTPNTDYQSLMSGKKRRALRRLANQQKKDGNMSQQALTSISKRQDPRWMEELDAKLWKHELVLLRTSGVFEKKKECKTFGEDISAELNAHLVQVLGRTILLYRPGSPPILDLEKMEGDDEEDHEMN